MLCSSLKLRHGRGRKVTIKSVASWRKLSFKLCSQEDENSELFGGNSTSKLCTPELKVVFPLKLSVVVRGERDGWVGGLSGGWVGGGGGKLSLLSLSLL